MQYLKTSLTSEAANIIQAIEINDDNYEIAWSNITKRYENNRLLITSLLNKLFSIPEVLPDNLRKLKQLYDTVKVVLDLLKTLK